MPDRYRWEPDTGRFRDLTSGRFLAEGTVRTGVEQLVDGTAARLRVVTERLAAGALPLGAWETAMAQEVRLAHTAAAAAARGGVAQLTPADHAWLTARLVGELEYLHGFAADLRAGRVALDTTAAASRAELYGHSAYGSYDAMRRRDRQAAGWNEERNELGAAERHCATCPDLSARGWVPAGTLPAVGSRSCRARCRCRIVLRRARAAVEA